MSRADSHGRPPAAPGGPTAPPAGRRRGFGRGPMAADGGCRPEKAMSFGPRPAGCCAGSLPSARVVGRAGAGRDRQRGPVAVAGPKILGRATDLIFAGSSAGGCPPAGMTKEQAAAAARAAGHGNVADMLAQQPRRPRPRHRLHRARHTCCCGRSASTPRPRCSAGCRATCSTTVVQRTVFRLRADVEDKLHRLPLRYFDTQPRGELLSRVTNDIDNIAQTLQQTMSQLLTSLLTVVGVVAMMLFISPLLAVIALVSIPLSIWSRRRSPSARRSCSSRSGSTPAR